MNYAYKITTHGRAAIAACMAMEAPPKITRVAFGSGRVDEAANLADMHELLEYVSDGAVGDRRHENDRFCFTIQYANSEHKAVKTFLLTEFIVYIKNPENGENTDLLYGTLGDYRQPVPAYDPAYPPSVFNFPLEVIISSELSVQVSAPAGLATWDDLEQLKYGGNSDTMDLTVPVEGWEEDAETGGGYPVRLDIPIAGISEDQVPILTILPGSLSAAAACGLCPAARTLPGVLRLYAKTVPAETISAVLTLLGESLGEIVIPAEGWEDGGEGAWPLRLDLPCPSAAKDLVPIVTILPESLETAAECGLGPSAQTLKGILRLYAASAPSRPIRAGLALIRNARGLVLSGGSPSLPVADAVTLGGVRVLPGSGLTVDGSGCLSLDAATAEDVAELFGDTAFGGSET